MSVSSRPDAAESQSRRLRVRQVGLLAIALLVGLGLGLVYLKFIHYALDVLWTDVVAALPNKGTIAAYMLAMTTLGAGIVAWLRRRTGVMGHSPLDGLKVSFDPLRVSLVAVVAVILTLLSGAVLGPEAGLIALGTALGTFFHRWSSPDAKARRALVNVGVLGAVLALVVQLGVGRTINITSGPVSLAWIDFLSSLPGATCAALLAAVVRLAAYRLRRRADTNPPVIARIMLIGLLVGGCGVAGVVLTDVDPRLILGSGEGYLSQVVTVTSISTLVAVLVFKAIAYALCLGGGLRGGPIFPAMFLGAATATIFTLAGMPGEATALIASGVLASTSVGIALGWRAAIIGGAVAGLLLGSWLLIAPSIYGLVIGRLIGGLLRKVPGVGPLADDEVGGPSE